ncbi:MAG: pyridoxal phosphate-dependent aminotransferase [Streptosporangiales bacterium]|nr:pyridoxal phosphate-dependent aminotransferase [Streptosporangiales bacterium]MBO0891814.1 pyridoxal phosphate-dependent aminotransferase [Acidothermales bacterium]
MEPDALASRLHGLGTTIFTEMSRLAVATGSVNLGQGFPDVDGPDAVLRRAAAAITGHEANQYAPGPGFAPLREAIAAHQRHWYGLDYDPDGEVLVTAGATEAVAAALLALVEPGGDVVALEPYYDSYKAGIAMAGGHRRPVLLRPPEFALDAAALRAAVTPDTRVLLLNSPHNPTGAVLSRAELDEIAAVAREHDLLVVTDEVYEHLVYDRPHIPFATLPGMRERTVSISSAGKTFAVTGWKIGWVCAPPDLVRAVATTKQFLTFTAGGPFQLAVAEALGGPDVYFEELCDGMRKRRDLLCDGLADVGFDVYVPAGTYFVTTDVRPLGFTDGLSFCRTIPERCGVVAVPHQVFYDDQEAASHLVRWAFCKRFEVLDEAVRRLRRLRG